MKKMIIAALLLCSIKPVFCQAPQYRTNKNTVERTVTKQITALSRFNGNMEVFNIRDDGSVWTNYFYDAAKTKWQQLLIAPPRSASINAKLACISRNNKTMTVFWITPNGAIMHGWWYDIDMQWHIDPPTAPLLPPGTASPEGSLSVVARNQGTMEFFWVAPNGSVNHAFWYDNGKNWGSEPLTPPGTALISNSSIAAVSRNPSAMEVFFIAPNGAVKNLFWYDGWKSWSTGEIATPGSAALYGGITAISSKSQNMEVFWANANGALTLAKFTDGKAWEKRTITFGNKVALGNSAVNSTTITSVSRKPSTIETMWIAPDGSVQTVYWYEGNNWAEPYPIAPANSASLPAGLKAVSRANNTIELFWQGPGGTLQDAFFYEGNKFTTFQLYPAQATKLPPGDNKPPADASAGNQLINRTETSNGITYNLFYNTAAGPQFRKGILVLGSGNNDANPNPGDMNDPQCVALCKLAAQNGYVTAVVQYTKGAPSYEGNNWNNNANQMAIDFDKCISAISTKYGIDKSKAVVGGFSYATFMLLTNNAYGNQLSYCKGQLAACGATDAAKAQLLKYPIYAITCSGNNEGDFSGIDLYNRLPDGPVKANSGGFTDQRCSTHCGGDFSQRMFQQLVSWLP